MSYVCFGWCYILVTSDQLFYMNERLSQGVQDMIHTKDLHLPKTELFLACYKLVAATLYQALSICPLFTIFF